MNLRLDGASLGPLGAGMRIPIYITTVATGAPKTGLAGGVVWMTRQSGAPFQMANTLVELDATNMKGWYYVAMDAGDPYGRGPAVMSYQTPTTAADIGKTECTFNSPVDLINWQGGEPAALSNMPNGAVVTTNLSQVTRGTEFNPFMFTMRDSTNHQPMPGIDPSDFTVKKSLDGTPFSALTDPTVDEIGLGWYKVRLDPADTDASVIGFNAKAIGADDTNLLIVTQPAAVP